MSIINMTVGEIKREDQKVYSSTKTRNKMLNEENKFLQLRQHDKIF